MVQSCVTSKKGDSTSKVVIEQAKLAINNQHRVFEFDQQHK
jgi:hypothetical protein